MLVVIFKLGDEPFAVQASIVREIAPLTECKRLPKSPDYVAGLADYRGEITPVIDLRRLVHGQPCARAMSSRILIVDYEPAPGAAKTLGLLAEKVTDTVAIQESDLSSSGLLLPDAPFLGDVFKNRDELVQLVTVEDLLGEQARAMLFPEAHDAA
jgi:chemotaxis-related protein WspB